MTKSGIEYRTVEGSSVKAETLKARALQLDEQAYAQEMELLRIKAISDSELEVEIETGLIEKQEKAADEARRRANNAMRRAKVPETEMVAGHRRFLMTFLERIETDHARNMAVGNELRSEVKGLDKEAAEAALNQAKEHDMAASMLEVTHGVIVENLDALPLFDPETGELVQLNRAQRRQAGK